MHRVCFVTNELYPIKPGGIGRLMYNFALHNRQLGSPAALHYLLPNMPAEEQSAIRSALVGLGVAHFCTAELAPLGRFGKLIDQLAEPSGLDEHLVRSLRYYAGLLQAEAEAGGHFDIIEFPDFGGWATATIAAKRAHFAFAAATIAVRLHSTCGIIVGAEPFQHRSSLWFSAINDLERHSIAGADRVVGHLASIVEFNAQFYGFDESWRERAIVEFPLIDLDRSLTVPSRSWPVRPRFLFSSRLQPFKCPDIFIRAAVRWLSLEADCPAEFVIASYGWDKPYIEWLRSLVPARLQTRISFVFDLPAAERDALISQSILVIPSIYESLCLLAYEGVASGAKLILNQRCLAFGASERWHDGRNCLMFDGSFLSLVEAMRRALGWQPTETVRMAADAPYWVRPIGGDAVSSERLGSARLAVIALGLKTLQEINSLLLVRNLRDGCDTLHIVVPRVLFEAQKLNPAMLEEPDLRFHLTEWTDPTPTEIDQLVRALDAELIAFLPSGMMIQPAFLSIARNLFDQDPGLAGVTSHSTVVADNLERSVEAVRLYAGDLPSMAVATSRICHRASVFRRAAFLETEIREEAGDRWFEEISARMVDAGLGIVCLPAALVSESVIRPRTRIADDVYYATRRSEIALQTGLSVKLDGLDDDRVDDFMLIRGARAEAIDGTNDYAAEIFTTAYVTGARITKRTGSDQDDYRDISIGLKSLRIGSRSWEDQFVKVAVFRGAPQIEFRDHGDMIFEHWPPPTSDKWGPILEFCPESTGTKLAESKAAIAQLTELDRRRLGAILDALPGVVSTATADAGFDRQTWLTITEALRRLWLGSEWA